jgi:hypothetical protein
MSKSIQKIPDSPTTRHCRMIDPVLPDDAATRNELLLADAMLDYFPLALAEVSLISATGSKQHHPDTGVWWDRTKSTDHANKLLRHLIDRGTFDADGTRHSAKVAWRALAMLQQELEDAGGKPGRASRWPEAAAEGSPEGPEKAPLKPCRCGLVCRAIEGGGLPASRYCESGNK